MTDEHRAFHLNGGTSITPQPRPYKIPANLSLIFHPSTDEIQSQLNVMA
jgi:hypothetical protein